MCANLQKEASRAVVVGASGSLRSLTHCRWWPCFCPGPFVEGDILRQMIQVSVHLTPRACDLVTSQEGLLFLDNVLDLDILLLLPHLPLAISMRAWLFQDSQRPSELSSVMRPAGEAWGRALAFLNGFKQLGDPSFPVVKSSV